MTIVKVGEPAPDFDLSVFASAMREEEVEATARACGMDEPLAIDDEHAIGDRFETEGLWPIYFLFDAEGKLRGRAAGAAGLGVLGAALERIAPAEPAREA